MPRLGGKAVLKGGQEQNSSTLIMTYFTVCSLKSETAWSAKLPSLCSPEKTPWPLLLWVFLVACVFCCVHNHEFLSCDPVSLTRAVSNTYLEVLVLFCYLHVKLLGLGWLLTYLHASTCLPSSAYHRWCQLRGWDFSPFLNFQLLVLIHKEGI